MRRVLMVSYDFPPSVAGIWRTIKFCKYMSEFGWEPSVLTVRPVRSARYDLAPLSQIDPDTEIRRTGSLDPNRLAYLWTKISGVNPEAAPPAPELSTKNASGNATVRNLMALLRQWIFIPDDRNGWFPFAVLQGWLWMQRKQFDVVYSTSFPQTAHLVGAALSRLSGVPLVADFRDSWTGNYEFFRTPTVIHSALHHAMEGFVVSSAQKVISVSGPIHRDFLRRYSRQPSGKFELIPNGFDPDDFPRTRPAPDRRRFTISYVGTMFGQTNPKWFFKAVRRLLKEEPRWRRKLRLRFVGSMIPEYQAMVRQAGLEDITSVEGYLPHEDAIRAMEEADLLLLIVPKIRGAEIMLTQKVFEYAAARRPILGLAPDGAAKDFLQEIGEGAIASPRDDAEILRALRGQLEEWERRGRRKLPANPALERYQRRNLTQRFCAVLDEVCESG